MKNFATCPQSRMLRLPRFTVPFRVPCVQSKIENQKSKFARLRRCILDPATVLTLLTLPTLMTMTGCSVLTYSSPTGERFTRSSLGTSAAIQSLAVDADTNGIRHVELKGYTNNQSDALSAVTQAAIKAALDSAK